MLDGRGSAPLSHEGAEAAVGALRREIENLEDQLAFTLDSDDDDGLAALSWQGLAQWLYTVSARVQRGLADRSGRTPSDYEFTLSLAIVGARRIGWMSVGDSPLVVCRSGVLFLPCRLETPEFANQTRFVQASPGPSPGLSGGLIPADGLELLAAMSDGAASRLIDLRGQVAAEAVRKLAACLAEGGLDQPMLVSLLQEEAWREATRDDRCLAILARSQMPLSPTDTASNESSEEVVEIPLQFSAESLKPVPRWILVVTVSLLLILLVSVAVALLSLMEPSPETGKGRLGKSTSFHRTSVLFPRPDRR